MAKLRPINETRRANGQLTSETASRLFRVRGGRARAKQMAADGYQHLHSIREKAILTNRANAASRRTCKQCKSIGEAMLKLIAMMQRDYPAIDATDLRKLL